MRLLTLLFVINCYALLPLHLHAQKQAMPLTVGYYGQVLVHPGVQLGTELTLKQWQAEREGNTIHKHLLLLPQLGFYNRPSVHSSGVLSAEVGYKRQPASRKSYHMVAAGLGYQARSEVLGLTVSLGNGEVTAKNRQWRHYLMPTLSYTYGRQVSPAWGWFTRATAGILLFGPTESSATLFTTFGVKINLNQ